MRILVIVLLVVGLFCSPVLAAERIAVSPATFVELTLPAGWVLLQEPPTAMVEEMAEHLGHDAEAKGHDPSPEQLIAMARKHLAANEAIIYHEQTGANLTIDFSPLHDDESPPGAKTVKTSAEYALQSLETEEGVTEFTASQHDIRIPGAKHAARIDSSYKQHDEAIDFTGIVGYAAENWFFLYFTNPGRSDTVHQEFEQLLAELKIVPKM
ncbi:MAG: hypothetical protein C0616_02235 [Desulfuromonas sp.]|nr:MAG: hypothetical protein C0616_02235 [Desulfuromonas sp.]